MYQSNGLVIVQYTTETGRYEVVIPVHARIWSFGDVADEYKERLGRIGANQRFIYAGTNAVVVEGTKEEMRDYILQLPNSKKNDVDASMWFNNYN